MVFFFFFFFFFKGLSVGLEGVLSFFFFAPGLDGWIDGCYLDECVVLYESKGYLDPHLLDFKGGGVIVILWISFVYKP